MGTQHCVLACTTPPGSHSCASHLPWLQLSARALTPSLKPPGSLLAACLQTPGNMGVLSTGCVAFKLWEETAGNSC